MRTITAMYDSRADAEEVVERLVSAGVARSDVSMVQQDASTETTAATTERESGGFLDSLANLFLPDDDRTAYSEGVRRGGVLLTARVDDDRVDEAIDVLERSSAVDVDSRAEEWRSSGWTGSGVASTGAAAATGYGAGLSEAGSRSTTTAGYEAGTTTSTSSRDYGTGGAGRGPMERTGDALSDAAEAVGLKGDDQDESRRGYGSTTTTTTTTAGTAGYADTAGMGAARVRDDGVVERAEERLVVGKRETGRGSVRVRSYVVETPVEEQVTLRDERVRVERRPVDRPVGAGDDVFQERTIEASERVEEAVVGKEARVVEEIGLRKEGGQRTETVRDTVRRQEVEVDDDRTTGAAGTTTTGYTETSRVSSTDVDALDDTTTTTTTGSTSRSGGL